MVQKFGTFEFDTDGGELRKNGRPIALEPQPARALALLLSRAGEIVSRDELREAVWGSETHVDFDRGIAYCLSQIRAALGDSGDNPRFIQTIPRRGFKFIAPVASASARGDGGELRRDLAGAASGREGGPVAPVAPVAPDAPVAPARAFNNWITIPLTIAMVAATVGMMFEAFSPRTDQRHAVIAVSVFDNETGQTEYDRTVAGLSDLVVERLTKIDPARVAVIGNAAVLRQPRNIRNLKAVAESVDADYVLLGQLQRGENGLRFITHFIRLRDEAHLKANRLSVADEKLTGLENAVVEEFERAVREHILIRNGN